MPYWRETWEGGCVKEVSKYHSYRAPVKGERRGRRVNRTNQSQIQINLRRAAKELRRLMNANFTDDDYLVTLDYRVDDRPLNSAGMQNDMKLFLQRLRRRYKKNEAVLKYIYVRERGKKGAAHIHIMISRCGQANIGDLLKECWTKGGVHIDPLNSDGQYVKIANYFLKYANKTIETEGEQMGKKWYPSRNLQRPVAKKEIIRGVNSFYEVAHEEKGYYIEKDSVLAGQTADGYDYFSYTLHKINKTRKRE